MRDAKPLRRGLNSLTEKRGTSRVNTGLNTPSAVRWYRFGPYELDLEQNELRKYGVRLKLERKPLQLLAVLLGRAGQVVTRSELRKLLWEEGVFVDYDKGLSVAVTKLRAVLNDAPDDPKYIVTVAGEGYRFVAAAEPVFASAACESAAQHNHTAERTGDSHESRANSLQPPPASARQRSWLVRQWAWLAAAGVLLVGASLAFFISRGLSRTKDAARVPPGPVRLAVLPFVNLTGHRDQEYLVDGMTDEMITVLGGVSPGRLAVIARSSSM